MLKILKFVRIPFVVFLFFLGACSKDEAEVIDIGSGTQGPAFYFYGTLDDGTEISCEVGESSYLSSAEYNNSMNGNQSHVEQSLILSSPSLSISAGVSLSQAFNATEENCNNFRSMFTQRNYGYGNIQNFTEGAAVFYVDEFGTYWATYQVGGSQPGGSFKITSQRNGYYGSGFNGITEAEFECTLYDQVGNWKKLTNGRIRSYSVQCFN